MLKDKNTDPDEQDSTGEDQASESIPSTADRAPDYREDLVEALTSTGDIPAEAEAEEETTEEVADTEAESEPEATEAEAEPEQASDKAEDPDKANHAYEHIPREWPDSARKRLSEVARQRRELAAKLDEQRADAAFGQTMAAIAHNAKIAPQALAEYLGLLVRGRNGDAAAAEQLGQLAESYGYKPKGTPATEPDLTAQVEQAYASRYKALVEEDELTEAAARKLALADVQARVAMKPQAAPPQQQQQTAPEQSVDPVVAAAKNAVDALEASYLNSPRAGAYGKAKQAIIARLAAIREKPPIYWVAEYERIAEEEMRRVAAPPKKTLKPVASKSVLPSGSRQSSAKAGDLRETLADDIMKMF